jgi:hypothetical protein
MQAIAVFIVVLLFVGCGGGSEGSGITNYQLTAGSEVRIPNIEDNSTRVEPLSGTFDTAPPPGGGYPVPGVGLSREIHNLQFHSVSLNVEGVPARGVAGYVEVTNNVPSLAVLALLATTINTQRVDLTGQNPAATFEGNPPLFRGVKVRGGGYEITIFAEPRR